MQSFTGSLTNFSQKSAAYHRRSESCINQSEANNESRSTTPGTNRTILNYGKSRVIATSHNKLILTDKKLTKIPTNLCHCSICTRQHDVPQQHIDELVVKLQFLSTELNEEKNNNQVLRRSFMMAKKVLQKEIGQKSIEDIESLLKRASGDGWKGKQEIIFDLKRQLRDLILRVECMEAETIEPYARKSKSSKNISDEREECWYLELERQKVFNCEEKYRQKIITSINSMKGALGAQSKRNDDLINEINILREKLSSVPKNTDEELFVRLREVGNKMKISFEEKAEERRKLDNLEQQICLNCRNVVDLKSKVRQEREIVKDNEVILKSLKINETNFRLLSEELSEEKCKQALIVRQLENMQKDFKKMLATIDSIFTSVADGKRNLGMLKSLQKKNITNNNGVKMARMVTNRKCKTGLTGYCISKLSVEVIGDSAFCLYKHKLIKYKERFHMLEHQNIKKSKDLVIIINKMEQDITILLKNRYVLWKLTSDINVLKIQKDKIRKVIDQLPKKKLVKKKNSCLQLPEIVDEERMHLNILKTEGKFLKSLIKRIFVSKGDDLELIESFFKRNKDLLLKRS